MTQPKQNQKNPLPSVDAAPAFPAQVDRTPAFSVKNVWVPEFRLPERVIGPGGFTVPRLDFLPFEIEFPCPRDLDTGLFVKDSPFMKLAGDALQQERRIVGYLVASKNKMDAPLAKDFQAMLVECPVVQNMLRRIAGLRENKQQVIPGVYLGCTRADPALGDILLEKLSKSYGLSQTAFPRDLGQLCSEWGKTQSKARSTIIEATWAQLVNRGYWHVPHSFEIHMGHLLEGEAPPRLSDDWVTWLHQIEALSKSAGDPVLEGCKTVRKWRSDDRQLTQEERAELRDNLLDLRRQFPKWGEFLKDSKFLNNPGSVNTDSLVDELFAVAQFPEARPFHVDFLNGAPERLVISEQQAIDWCALYLAHCGPREVTIRYSSDPNDSAWRRLRRTPEVEALVSSPIAEFITQLEFDCFGLSPEGCRELFEVQLKFLNAYEMNEAWRNDGKDRTIEVLFTNASNRGPKDSLAALQESAQELNPEEVKVLFRDWKIFDKNVEPGASSSGTLRITWLLDADPGPG